MKKTTQQIDAEAINLFCEAIDGHPLALPGATPAKYALFIGKNMFGHRTYASPRAASQAIVKLIPRILHTMKGKQPGPVVTRVRRALKDRKLRQQALAEAIIREKFSIQRISLS